VTRDDKTVMGFKINYSVPFLSSSIKNVRIFGFKDSKYKLPDGTYAEIIGYEGYNQTVGKYFANGVIADE
jgi:hypothetical protein